MKKYIFSLIYLAVGICFFAIALILITKSGTLEEIFAAEVEENTLGVCTEWESPALPSGNVPLESIGFNETGYIRIISSGTYKLEIVPNPEGANENIFWSSSQPHIANVDKDGMISAYSPGTTSIIAQNYTGRVRSMLIVDVLPLPDKFIDVPYINQLRDYPNGCESCSTVMALNHVGIDITVDEFIENYLDMAPLPAVIDGVYSAHSPWYYFLGDPREASGLCCYAPCIVNALNKFVDTEKYEIHEMYNVPLETLCRQYINNNIPIIFWGTMYMKEPLLMTNWSWAVIDGKEGERFTWMAPMHCLLMVGFDDEYYYFNDPVSGKGVAYTKEATERAYAGLYYQAVTVVPKDNPAARK